MPTKMKYQFRQKTKTKVTCAYITELSYVSVANITFSALRKWDFWNETKMKIHFRPKTKTNVGRLLVWWLDLTDPDPSDFTTVSVLDGVTLSVNAFEFWHARGPSGHAPLAKDLICAPASQVCVQRIFCLWASLYYGRRSAMFRSLEMRVYLKLNQIKCWKKPLVHSNHLSETWC